MPNVSLNKYQFETKSSPRQQNFNSCRIQPAIFSKNSKISVLVSMYQYQIFNIRYDHYNIAELGLNQACSGEDIDAISPYDKQHCRDRPPPHLPLIKPLLQQFELSIHVPPRLSQLISAPLRKSKNREEVTIIYVICFPSKYSDNVKYLFTFQFQYLRTMTMYKINSFVETMLICDNRDTLIPLIFWGI